MTREDQWLDVIPSFTTEAEMEEGQQALTNLESAIELLCSGRGSAKLPEKFINLTLFVSSWLIERSSELPLLQALDTNEQHPLTPGSSSDRLQS